MKRIAVTLIALTLPLCVLAGTEVKDELSGILKTNVKALSPYLLRIDGGGTIGLRGDLLKSIPDGTRIWIKGEFHSFLYDNRKDPTPAMMPLQWHMYVDVKECKVVTQAFERPDEKGLQNQTSQAIGAGAPQPER
jgi:hypothetical protein